MFKVNNKKNRTTSMTGVKIDKNLTTWHHINALAIKRYEANILFNSFMKRSQSYANQWTGFYMIGTSVKKELNPK